MQLHLLKWQAQGQIHRNLSNSTILQLRITKKIQKFKIVGLKHKKIWGICLGLEWAESLKSITKVEMASKDLIILRYSNKEKIRLDRTIVFSQILESIRIRINRKMTHLGQIVGKLK